MMRAIVRLLRRWHWLHDWRMVVLENRRAQTHVIYRCVKCGKADYIAGF